MRDTFTLTIDPLDARDFDDAISMTRLDNGDLEIGVHIADVSHYVNEVLPWTMKQKKEPTQPTLLAKLFPCSRTLCPAGFAA